MVDDVVALLGAKDYRDHMRAEKFGAFFVPQFAPALLLRFDLTHPHSDLSWAQIRNFDRRENWFPNGEHGVLPLLALEMLASCLDVGP